MGIKDPNITILDIKNAEIHKEVFAKLDYSAPRCYNCQAQATKYDFQKESKIPNTTQNLGNTAFGFLLSALIISGWLTAFARFFVGLIPLIMIWLFVTIPDDKAQGDQATPTKLNSKEAVNTHILLLALLFLVVSAVFLMMTIKMAVFYLKCTGYKTAILLRKLRFCGK